MKLPLRMESKTHARIPWAALTMLPLLSLCASLQAQSMDYGALEQLFKESVTTSVDGSPQRISDAPATMEIITAEEIRRSGAKDIPGVLRHVEGIDTLEWGNDDVDVSVRGYDQAYSPRLLVLLDGRQVYADHFGYTPWSTVPVELAAIRQIEVIKGPNSALFGFNAVDGVINIITYNPLYDTVDRVSSTGATQDLRGVSAVAMHQFGTRAAVRLSIGGYLDNDFSTLVPLSEDVATRVKAYRDAVNINSIVRLNAKTEIGIEASQSATQQSEMQPVYQMTNSRYTTESGKLSLTMERRIGLLHASGYTNWLQATTSPGFAGLAFHFDNRVTVAEFDNTFKLGVHHVFRGAIEYRRNTEPTTSTVGGIVHYNNYAASGMWNWKLTPILSLTNALRIDHLSLGRDGYLPPDYPFVDADWNRFFTVPSFTSALVVKPNESNSVRIVVSRGTQLPSLNLLGAFLVDTPYLKVSGNPGINPAAVTNYEIGWDHAMRGPRLLFRVSSFHQSNQNIPAVGGAYFPIPGGGGYISTTNIGSSDANGLELGLKGELASHLRWGLNDRPETIADHFIPSAQNANAYVDYQHTTPTHLVKGDLGWAHAHWELDSFLHYQPSSQGIRPTATTAALVPVPGFTSIDARVAYTQTRWATWSISGQNLTHAIQIQTAGPAVERRMLGTLSINF